MSYSAMSVTSIRLAKEADAEELVSLYAPYCSGESAVSFDTEPPNADEMALRISNVLQRYPWLVCEAEPGIVGFINATPHQPRGAYIWSVTTAVYVHDSYHRRGIGYGLYGSLLPLLRHQGFFNAYACITIPNPRSTGLHSAMGFTPIGRFHNVGYKAGAWRDVEWWHCPLQPPRPSPPLPPMDMKVAQQQPWFPQVLAEGVPAVHL